MAIRDCRPPTSGREVLSEKEKQVLGGFWVYVQPMSLYRHIQQRQQSQVGAQCLLQAFFNLQRWRHIQYTSNKHNRQELKSNCLHRRRSCAEASHTTSQSCQQTLAGTALQHNL